MNNTKPNTTRNITVAAMLSAVAFILMFIEFPIPMLIPSFIKMDISDLPALLGTFALGPIYGVVIELLKNLLHILIKGTSSAGVGELSNFLLGAVFAFTAGLIYKKNKTKTGAIIASVVGAVLMGVVSVPMNYFVVYPAYVVFYHMPMEAIIGMYQAVIQLQLDAAVGLSEAIAIGFMRVPLEAVAGMYQGLFDFVNSLLPCLLLFNLPFTICKGLLCSVLCALIYKPLSPILHGRK